MSAPTPEAQIKFLSCLQRLLAEGQFVATYKFALLVALADISVEDGDDSGNPLVVETTKIAEKFIRAYWRHAMPYVPKGQDIAEGMVLMQNTGRQAELISMIATAGATTQHSLAAMTRRRKEWDQLVRTADRIVRNMPLWKLQTVGRQPMNFLYDNIGTGTSITLKPGVVFCFRKFYDLITDLVRGAWLRYIRRENVGVLGETTDLHEFLFGSERVLLNLLQPMLRDVQSGRCFYCRKELAPRPSQVDHFVPWTRYPVDLGHNFVLAHDGCNSAKSDRLAAAEHLDAWVERNRLFGKQMSEEFERVKMAYGLSSSVQIARWAYSQTYSVKGLTWVRGNDLVPLPDGWDSLLKLSI
ncbi:MAG TPA: HNH endonuclease signature motif containing protein [Terriglobales bacterium]|jgi:hypothetical protein